MAQGLSSLLGGLAQGFTDLGKSTLDVLGGGTTNNVLTAGLDALINKKSYGQAVKDANQRQKDFRKWLYETDSDKDAAAKGLGTALNGAQTAIDLIPGLGQSAPVNAIQGAIGGLADEFKFNGENYDWGKGAQRAVVGAGAGLAAGGLGKALANSGSKVLSNGVLKGAATGSLGGALSQAGNTAIEGGNADQILQSAAQGAQFGALLGAGTGGVQSLAGALKKTRAKNNAPAIMDDEVVMAELAPERMIDSAGEEIPAQMIDRYKDVSPAVRDENGQLMRFYHGTPDATFESFRDGTYFTPNKWYADYYQNPAASSISFGKKGAKPGTYEAYLDIKKPFDISNPEDRRVYIDDYIKGGNAASIDPYRKNYDDIENIDWTEVENLREFLQDNGYDYDAIIADEGGFFDENGKTVARGKSYIPFSGEQATKLKVNYGTEAPKAEQQVMAEMSPEQNAVADAMLSPEQREYFKDSVIRDENGNLKPMYHGTKGDFTVFGHGKSNGTSNNNSSVGFWFTPTEKNAKNWAESTWYGSGEPKAMETYLNMKNPKIYESVDNSEAVAKLRKELDSLRFEPKNLSDTNFYHRSMYDSNQAMRMVETGDVDMALKWLTGKGYDSDKAAEYVDELVNLNKLNSRRKSLQDSISDLKYGDAYERFRTDLYKVGGQTAEDANLGGIGMALNDRDTVQKYVDGLRSQGYDGIIIKGTNYDADVMGGPNDQYVVFDSNQIKDVNNLTPTDNVDIMASRVAPGQLGLFDQTQTTTPKTATTQLGLFDQPTQPVTPKTVDVADVNPYAPVNGKVTDTMRNRASEIIDSLALKRQIPDNELFNRIDPATLPKGQQGVGKFLDEAYAKGLSRADITDMMRETVSSEFDKRLGKTPDKEKLISFIFGDADETTKKEMMDKELGLYVAPETVSESTLNSMARHKISDEIYGNNLSALSAGNRTLRGGYTGALDSVLSERLGIAPGNTYKKTGTYDTDGSLGRFQEYPNNPYKNNIMVEPALDNEDAINTMAHERLHSFQTEAKKLYDKDRYSPEVKNAYDELAKDLKRAKAYKTGNEIRNRYYGRNMAYWRHHDEQEARMLQQYLDAKGYTGSRHHNEKQYLGLEFDDAKITPAFDKFFDKLRELSKKGVALPAILAALGLGEYATENQEEDKDNGQQI